MKRPTTIRQLSKETFEILHYSTSQPDSLATGFKNLDKYQIFMPGELVLIGGRPKMGKSALALDFALNFSKNTKTLYQSVEISEEAIFELIVKKAGWLQDPSLTICKEEYLYESRAIHRYINSLSKLEVHGGGIFDFSTYFDEMLELTLFNDYKAVVLDCSFFTGEYVLQSKRKRINKMLKSLNRLREHCKKFNVCLVLTTALNEKLNKRKNKRPRLSDLMIPEMGLICDKFASLYRPAYYGTYKDRSGIDITGIADFSITPVTGGSYYHSLLSFNGTDRRFEDSKILDYAE